MARPKKQPLEPGWFHQSTQAKFIKFAVARNAPALRLLCTRVWRSETSVEDWAKQFNVSGTWVEQWAKDTLKAWHASTAAPPETGGYPWYTRGLRDPVPAGLRRCTPGVIACPPPCVLEADQLDMEYPLPREALEPFDGEAHEHRGNANSAWSDECPHCGRKETAKRRKLRKRLIDETTVLDSKIECAAVYLLASKTVEELAPEHHISSPAMHVWLKEATALLRLKMWPRGHRPIIQ